MGIHTFESGRRRSFAVVGSGMAGMSAAWLLSQRHDVTVFEREPRLGGHSNTVVVETVRGPVPVDTGFIVYNAPNYPNLTALFEHLGVGTEASNMSFSVSLDGGAFEYAGGNGAGLLAQPACLLRADYIAMMHDLLRFYREAPEMLADRAHVNLSLGEYLKLKCYSEAFARLHLLPMAAAIWSSSIEAMRAHPVRSFVRFFANHGLFKLVGRPEWRTVSGGSCEYVKKLTARYADNVRVGQGVRAVLRDASSVTIVDAHGERHRHDAVVIAAHTDEALKMLDRPSADERALLGAFAYRPNLAVLHDDLSLMPKRKLAWASWNYIGSSKADVNADLCVTYWMNRLQNINKRTPLFVTLNPIHMPHDNAVKATFQYEHPVFDAAALTAQDRLWTLQGANRTWFCGSYFGSGFHEDALQAGLAAAEEAGGVRRPWRVAKESSRITLAPRLAQATA